MSAFAAAVFFFSRSAMVFTRIGRTARRLVTSKRAAPPPARAYGSGAFMPNPTIASMGDQIVFTNTDLVLHHIVLDDGTDLGNVAPGQSSPPMPLATPTATFHCTIHPSMVGAINGDIVLPPYEPPPSDDYYG